MISMDRKDVLLGVSCSLFCVGGVVLATTDLEWFQLGYHGNGSRSLVCGDYRGLK
jgi:inner membrane protein involved in colicin E2 resistance